MRRIIRVPELGKQDFDGLLLDVLGGNRKLATRLGRHLWDAATFTRTLTDPRQMPLEEVDKTQSRIANALAKQADRFLRLLARSAPSIRKAVDHGYLPRRALTPEFILTEQLTLEAIS